MPEPVVRVGAEFRWDRSSSFLTGLTIGAADFPAAGPRPSGAPARRGGASAHLAISPVFAQFAVFSRGVDGDFSPLTAAHMDTDVAVFARPLACDGRTTHRAEIVIDRALATAHVTVSGLPPLVFTDPRIRSVAARYPFWEYYSVPGGTNLPRFSTVWADSGA